MIKIGDHINVDGVDCTVIYYDESKVKVIESNNHKYSGQDYFEWGAYGVLIGGTSKEEGTGLVNSNLILANDSAYVPYSSNYVTVWTVLKSFREETGNNNWYLGSCYDYTDYAVSISSEISSTEQDATYYTNAANDRRGSAKHGRDRIFFMIDLPTAEFDAIVEISQEDGADIRYTDDGTDPDETDTLYESPVLASNGDTIKARAYLDENTFSSDITSVTIDTSFLPKTETIPLGTELEDGYIVYDRGEDYGDYNLSNGKLTRLSGGDDDGTSGSANWRFLVIAKEDMPGNDSDEGNRVFSITAPTGIYAGLGYGIHNTNNMLYSSASNSDTIWYEVYSYQKQHGDKWFVPSMNEASEIFNQSVVTLPVSNVYFSSYYSTSRVYAFDGSGGIQYITDYTTNTTVRVRLMYRV